MKQNLTKFEFFNQGPLFYARLFIPMIAVFVGGYIANNESDSDSNSCGNGDNDIYDENEENQAIFQPKDWVFGVAWGILTLHIGISWVIANQCSASDTQKYIYDGLLALIVILLAIWPSMYKDYKDTWAVWLMYIILLVLVIFMILAPRASQLVISPLVIWLLFAISLLQTEIINTHASEMYEHVEDDTTPSPINDIIINRSQYLLQPNSNIQRPVSHGQIHKQLQQQLQQQRHHKNMKKRNL